MTPEGVNLTYITGMEGFTRPPKPTMLQFPQGDYMKPETYPNTTVGLFGEFAVPVTNLEAALAYWKQLGFEAATTFSSPYPWAIVTDGLHIVGLHQTNMFVQPALTFFAADMQLKIATLREAGVTGFLDEGLKNTKLSTPEGQHLNLYHLGM
ncbi:MAG: hypothetical protein EBZ77_03420 [Chitinophagia bacterium]|nr:hypothetical protein [Chitinophagia bacterium]